jgi:probable rRNA maturation factor
MPVDISSSVETSSDLERHLARAAEALLGALDHSASDLEVALVSDDEIAVLNRDYRGKDRPTDVLSFPQLEGEAVIDANDEVHLGDIVVSLETAKRQADEGGWTLEEETARLVLHGLLHLLGFDHENSGEEEASMKAEEFRLVSVLRSAGIACAHEQTDSAT